MFIVVSVLTCGALLPLNLVYNLKYVDSDKRNYLLALTMSKVKGNWLWYVSLLTFLSSR